MVSSNKKIGKIGENYALNYLKERRFKILEKNFTCHWGEIDLVAKKDDKIIFIEVKTRVGEKKGKPYEAINYYKLQGLKRAINFYLLKNKIKNCKLSLDLISVMLNEDLSLKELKYFENISN